MSAFTKPPNEASSSVPNAPKPDGPSAKPAPPTRPAVPPVVVTRTIDVGGPTSRTRPAAPTITVSNVSNVSNVGNVGNASNVSSPAASRPPALPGNAPVTAAPTPPLDPAATPPSPPARPAASPTPTLRLETPKSVRPPAPPLVQGQAQGDGTTSLNESFERMLASDIEKELDAIERGPEMAPTVEGSAITDMAEVRSLFAELAAGYVRPVRDFLIDLRWGEATVEWIDICEPSLRSLRRAAERLELTELCQALDVFSGALAATKTSGSRAIEGEHRAALLACQEKLADVMPQAFALENERSQRESVILHALLLQIPNVTKLTLDRVYGAGLNSLEAMCLASAADLAATTGIDPALAGRIVARFREYHAQARALVPDAAHAAERERIRTLLARLKVENDEYEAAAGGWSHEATVKKKELRATRMRTLLDLQVLLARLGEVERLKELERLPFERKLSYLESFLEEARKKYAAQP